MPVLFDSVKGPVELEADVAYFMTSQLFVKDFLFFNAEFVDAKKKKTADSLSTRILPDTHECIKTDNL